MLTIYFKLRETDRRVCKSGVFVMTAPCCVVCRGLFSYRLKTNTTPLKKMIGNTVRSFCFPEKGNFGAVVTKNKKRASCIPPSDHRLQSIDLNFFSEPCSTKSWVISSGLDEDLRLDVEWHWQAEPPPRGSRYTTLHGKTIKQNPLNWPQVLHSLGTFSHRLTQNIIPLLLCFTTFYCEEQKHRGGIE